MFSIIATLVVMTLSTSFGFVSDANGQWPRFTEGQHSNSIEIGGKFYNRPGTQLDIPLVVDSITNATFFDANQATAVSSAPGVELAYNFKSRFGRKLQFRTVLANFDTSTTVAEDNMESPLFPGVTPSSIDYNYDSQIFSFELMGSRPLAQGLTLFAGPRYVRFKDNVTLDSIVPFDPGDGFPPFNGTDERTFEAINSLIGLQAGVNLDYQLTQYFKVQGYLRTGGYYNPTRVNFRNSQTAAGVTNDLADFNQSKSTGSFLAETGGRLYVDIRPGVLQAYGGYEATWIDGIALAPPQFLTTELEGVKTSNTLFMHAITFGLRMSY